MAEFHPLRSLEEATLAAARSSSNTGWPELDRRAEALAKQVPSADMPSLDHLSMKDFDEVYEPSDDTYLMLDALQHECRSGALTNLPENPVVLEIGSGSGVNIAFLGALLRNGSVVANNNDSKNISGNTQKNDNSPPISQQICRNPLLFVTDINPKALQVTRGTVMENTKRNEQQQRPICFEAVQCDLITPMQQQWKRFVDVLIFNPPYVPTPDDEIGGQGIEASWAGGEKGRRVVDRAIAQIGNVLSHPHGVAYLITVDDNEPQELARQFSSVAGLTMEPLLRRRAHNEYLSVQKLTWKQ